MSSQAFVNFKELYKKTGLPVDLIKELRQVELTLNLSPTAKVDNKYVASPTNISVTNNLDLVVRKIASMVEQGLSYSNGDYYIFVQFGGKPTVSKSPNGLLTALSKLADKAGMIANINTGCVYDGFKELNIIRDGHIDTLHLVNDPNAEVKQLREGDIVAPYAVITLTSKATGLIVSRKVTIVRNNEYLNAKKQGSYTHKTYPVPMAVKIALKRAAQEMMGSLGLADSEEMEQVHNEIKDHNADYDMNKVVEQKEPVIEKETTSEKDDGVIDINSL